MVSPKRFDGFHDLHRNFNENKITGKDIGGGMIYPQESLFVSMYCLFECVFDD
jgi:hypothetical protein